MPSDLSGPATFTCRVEKFNHRRTRTSTPSNEYTVPLSGVANYARR
jgi:hypothetical protein